VQLRYPEGVRSIIDTDLELRGDASAPVLAGTVTVREAVLLDGLELGGGLFGGGGVDDTLVVSAPEEPGLPLEFDIQIVAPSSLQIRNNTTRIVGSAELTLQGTYDRPLLFGTTEIDRGEAFFLGNRYRVNYGTIGFANPTRIEPFVNVELETDVRVPGQTYRVAVQATGTLDRLVLTLTSDPPLPEVDIVSLLCGDIRDPQGADLRAARAPELAQQQRLQACAAGQLTSALSSGVGRVVEESFGVDTFQITPSFGDPSSQQSAQLNPTARVLIGKRISDRAHLTLSRALSGANSDLIVVLEYDQSDRLSWILSQNEDRTYALDFRVRHAF
jgi:autotransporter translocation and assembly factor TamB